MTARTMPSLPHGLGWRLLACATAFWVVAGAQPAESPAPFRISDNHRYLIDRQNVPFLLQGDAAWSLIANVTKEEATAYLQNRHAKGFNAILVNLVEHKFAKAAPRNAYGEAPFPDPADFSVQNEKYFEHADWVIREAAKNGLTVLLAPVYLGYPGLDEGYYDEVMSNGPEKCLVYGRFLGRRYKDFDNIIWVLGGDRDPGPARPNVDMVAYGIRESDRRHLMTAHCHSDSSTAEQYPGSWLQVGTSYAYEIVHLRLNWDYERKPAMPLFLIESIYEGEHNSSEVQIRRQAYWAVLCGEFGHVFGNLPIWSFNPGWPAAMDSPGSVAMMHWGELFRSRPWHDLVPDQAHQVVTGGLGEFWGLDYLTAAAAPDGRTMIAYMPTTRTITVDLTKLAKGQANAWWFDPRSGKATSAGTFATEGTKQFTPPADGDWALVLDDAAKQLPAPGNGSAGAASDSAPKSTAEQPSATAKKRPAWEIEWAYLSKYSEANAQLAAPAAGEKRVVFFGDSITEGWNAGGNFFPGKSYVNRGIGGQTTAQMLVRFRQDVIGLKPALVVILAGTNDIAENGGPTTLDAIENNLQSMAELARANGIRVILSSVLPVFDYPWRPGLQPADKISALNRWIAAYCAKNQLVSLDYHTAMVDGRGGLRPELSGDGVHPNAAGYALMAPLAEKAIREALK